MSFRTASAILRGKWLINKQYAEQHAPIIFNLFNGTGNANLLYDKKGYADDRDDSGEDQRPRNHCALTVSEKAVIVGYYQDWNQAPQGSIALIRIAGPILKYGDMCTYGSIDYERMITNADGHPNIGGIALKIDSPGGQVDGTASLASAIKNTKKPVYGFVDDGMMASAAMWIGSAADKLYAGQKHDWIGSVGVYCTLYDWKAYAEKQGLPVHEIYAPQSTEKNADYKLALTGDYSAVEADLKFIANEFITAVKNNRGELAAANMEAWSNGAMFYAEEAVKVGLIDGIKSFDEVVLELNQVVSSQSSRNTNSDNTMFGSKKFQAIEALKGVQAEAITEEMIDQANANLTEAGIEHVTLVPDAHLVALEATDVKLIAAQEALVKMTGERDEWQKKAEEYGKQPGEVATKTRAEKDKLDAAKKETWVDPEAEHNKYIVAQQES